MISYIRGTLAVMEEDKVIVDVGGVIPGERSDEYVIVGAHRDHWGIDLQKVGDQIYNGADDNASGVSCALQIARAIKASGKKPLRTMLFAFWDGEEKGTLTVKCKVTPR